MKVVNYFILAFVAVASQNMRAFSVKIVNNSKNDMTIVGDALSELFSPQPNSGTVAFRDDRRARLVNIVQEANEENIGRRVRALDAFDSAVRVNELLIKDVRKDLTINVQVPVLDDSQRVIQRRDDTISIVQYGQHEIVMAEVRSKDNRVLGLRNVDNDKRVVITLGQDDVWRITVEDETPIPTAAQPAGSSEDLPPSYEEATRGQRR